MESYDLVDLMSLDWKGARVLSISKTEIVTDRFTLEITHPYDSDCCASCFLYCEPGDLEHNPIITRVDYSEEGSYDEEFLEWKVTLYGEHRMLGTVNMEEFNNRYYGVVCSYVVRLK